MQVIYETKRPVQVKYSALSLWPQNPLKAELKRKGVTYAQLVGELAEIGVDEKEVNVRNKLSWGTIYSGVSTAMCDSDKRDRGALVALGLLLIAVALVAPLPLLETAAQFAIDQATQQNQGQERSGKLGTGWSLLDPYAQWVMASLAAFATLFSAVGIFLLRRTFEETKRTADAAMDANSATREIGRDQLRAYVSVNRTTIAYDHSRNIEALVFVDNTGQTPATFVAVAAQVVAISRADLPLSHPYVAEYDAVGPIGASTRDVPFRIPYEAILADPAYAHPLSKEGKVIAIQGHIRYGTVFNEIYESDFMFYVETQIIGIGQVKAMRRVPSMFLRTYRRIEDDKQP